MQATASPTPAAAEPAQPHTSTLLHALIDDAPAEHFTLDWLIGHMPKYSFGIIMLFLALLSLLPVISVVARLLMLFLALQILLGYHSPVLPKRLTARALPSRYLAHLNWHAIPALRHLEKGVRPRLPRFLLAARRITALIAIVLTLFSLLAPLPLANVPPAAVRVLMALAYIEHDGLLLLVALFSATVILTIVTASFFL